MAIEMKYKAKNVTVEELCEELDRIWPDFLREDSRASRKALEAGLSAEDMKKLRTFSKREDAINVKYESAALDPATIIVIIQVAGQLIKILLEKVIIPRLEEDKSADVLTPDSKKSADDATEEESTETEPL